MNKENLQGLDWQRWVMWLLALKLFGALFVTFGEFSHPHIIRQVDTMGVALRYWSRWILEQGTSWPLLPAVLTAGDASGITPMEFPIMNLVYAPFFALPVQYARTAAWSAHVIFMAVITYWHFRAWRGKQIAGVHADRAAAIIPLIGIASIFSGRFMPDYPAFLLVSLAVALSWDEERPLVSFLLASLGLLMKPPAILAVLIVLLQPRNRIFITARWVLPSIATTILYYKLAVPAIKSVSDYPTYFYTSLRNPFIALTEFASEPRKIWKFMTKNLVGPQYFVFLLIAVAFVKKMKEVLPLLAVLILQIIAGAALDGAHSFEHYYYYIGISFVMSLLVVSIVVNASSRVVTYVALVTVLSTCIEQYVYESNSVLAQIRGRSLKSECASLKERQREFPWGTGYRFRSVQSVSPDLGLCFGEIQNSHTSEYGFFRKEEAIPTECTVVARSNNLALVKCGTPKI